MEKIFYITTPIYYPNDKPHVGSLYTTVLADFLARSHEILGYKSYMLTGLDEHGSKLQKTAEKHGKSPQEFVDEIQKYFREAWKKFQINYFRFIRTTDKQHEEAVKYALEKLHEKGYIYKGKYAGYYCVKCEAFYPVSRLIKEGDKYLCPIHRTEVEFLEEDTYYLKISEFKDWIKEYILKNEKFIWPPQYKNEVLNYIEEIGDVSIARPKDRVPWGIEFPIDKNYTIYVWIDALLNYLTAIGWPDEVYRKYWPAVHVIGKDILKFHAVIWPIVLKMLDIEPPKQIIVHGFWTVKGLKIGKSLKDVIDITKLFLDTINDVEAYRYFLLRNAPLEKDSEFSIDEIYREYNEELADIIGNGYKRVTTLALKIKDTGVIRGRISEEVKKSIKELVDNTLRDLERISISQYVLDVIKIFKYLNEYIQEKEPWKNRDENVIYDALYITKIGFSLLYPILPEISKKALENIGTPLKPLELALIEEGFYVKESPILFPKK